MAERERLRTDFRAVWIGVTRTVPVTLVTFGVLYAITRAVWAPVMRDFGRGGSLPSAWALGVLAAVVGGVWGWSAMRGARRVVVKGPGSESITGAPGSRALALTRASRASNGGARLAKPVPVQRWSADLLDGSAPVQDPGEVTS